MASILDDERFQNLQSGLAKALHNIRTTEAAKSQAAARSASAERSNAEKYAFEREKLATEDETKRIGIGARLPGSAGVYARSRLAPGVSKEQLQREDLGKTYIEDLLQHGQYEAASGLGEPLGIGKFGPSEKEKAQTESYKALEQYRKQRAKDQSAQSKALTFLYGQRANEVKKRISKIDRELGGATNISQLKSASDIFRNELEGVNKQLEELKLQKDYYLRDEKGNLLDRDGEITTNVGKAAVNPDYIVSQDALLSNAQRLRERLSGLSHITGEKINIPGEAESEIESQIQQDLSYMEGEDPETIKRYLLKKYPDYIQAVAPTTPIGPERPPAGTQQQQAFGPQLPVQRQFEVDASPEVKAQIQNEFNSLMQNRPKFRSEEEHKKAVIEYLSRKYYQ